VTYLSIIVIIGATITAAEAAATRSAPSLNPRFLVFHLRGSDTVCLSITGGRSDGLVTTIGVGKPFGVFLSSFIAESLATTRTLYKSIERTGIDAVVVEEWQRRRRTTTDL
jgi:hypothetical protein